MLKILTPGLLTTVQDLGRYGYQKYGVIVSGVMDPLAHRLANILIGNDENAPTLEITLLGPSIEFQEDALISLCGGDLSATINGRNFGLWRPIYVKKGSILSFGQSRLGCRAYLAVAGGYQLEKVMNSYSTYIRAEIGGYKGRPLKKDDQIPLNEPSVESLKIIQYLKERNNQNKAFIEAEWSVGSDLLPNIEKEPVIRVMDGRNSELFDDDSLRTFYSKPFDVSTQSDRMGYRLQGKELRMKAPEDMISEAVSFGTIQVPLDGNPIILLADRQTTGGYPKIAQIITVDLPKAGQLKPGDKLRFKPISHEEAQLLYLEREKQIQQLKNGIALKIKIY